MKYLTMRNDAFEKIIFPLVITPVAMGNREYTSQHSIDHLIATGEI